MKTKYCKFLTNSALLLLIMELLVSISLAAEKAPSVQTVKNSMDSATSSLPEAQQQVAVPGSTRPAQATWKHGSLMFDKKTSGWIREAVKSYEQQIPLEILLPDIFPSERQPSAVDTTTENSPKPDGNIMTEALKKIEAPKEAPVFYLKSILYLSPEHWSVWLNNNRISDETGNVFENITIIKVSWDEVIFLWQNAQINLVYPDWKNNFTGVGDNKYVSITKDIVVDEGNGNILFILKPNQSLTSRPLEIVEGPAKTPVPGTVTTTPEALKPPEPTASKPGSSQETKTYTKPLEKNTINSLESLKNIEILKSLLE